MEEILKTGLLRLGLEPVELPCSVYLHYVELLYKWNRTYNLTAIEEPEEMLRRHVLDSLTVLSYIKGTRCLDVGTGPGLPGFILALAQPEKHWVLLDSNQKKIRFLRHVKAELQIQNIEIVQSRVEDYINKQPFDTVICRAFAPLSRILKLTSHLITKDNQLLAMKGRQADEEVSELGKHNFLIEVKKLPNIDENSSLSLLHITKKA